MAHGAGLDLASIVDASITIADNEGIGKVTMRRLSAYLEVTPMAIYRHVANKDALIDLVLDESLRAIPHVDRTGDPVVELVAWGNAFHGLLVGHPSLAHELATRRLEGPGAVASARLILQLLERHGVNERRADELLTALVSFSLGAALYRVSRRSASELLGNRVVPGDGSGESSRFSDRLSRIEISDDAFSGGLAVLIRGYLREPDVSADVAHTESTSSA